MRRALRSNELGCPLIILFRSVQIDRRIRAIPNAIDPRFESGVTPDAAFDSSDNQTLLGRPLANIDCRLCSELHHNTASQEKKIVRRIVYAVMINIRYVHFQFIGARAELNSDAKEPAAAVRPEPAVTQPSAG